LISPAGKVLLRLQYTPTVTQSAIRNSMPAPVPASLIMNEPVITTNVDNDNIEEMSAGLQANYSLPFPQNPKTTDFVPKQDVTNINTFVENVLEDKLIEHPSTPSKDIVPNLSYRNSNSLIEPISPQMMLKSIWTLSETTSQLISDFLFDLEGGSFSFKDAIMQGSFSSAANLLDDSTASSEVLDNNVLGVGLMTIKLISAFKYNVNDAADGDHYVLLSLDENTAAVTGMNGVTNNNNREVKTHTVYSSATPIFNAKWVVKMAHFRSVVKLYLID